MRSVSFKTASMYSSELTLTAVISDSCLNAVRISLVSLERTLGLVVR